jgi:hypothetical protein
MIKYVIWSEILLCAGFNYGQIYVFIWNVTAFHSLVNLFYYKSSGHMVVWLVEALCYKVEGHGSDSRGHELM